LGDVLAQGHQVKFPEKINEKRKTIRFFGFIPGNPYFLAINIKWSDNTKNMYFFSNFDGHEFLK